jgi:hypothetical protein
MLETLAIPPVYLLVIDFIAWVRGLQLFSGHCFVPRALKSKRTAFVAILVTFSRRARITLQTAKRAERWSLAGSPKT